MLMSGRVIPTILGKRAEISRNWATAHVLIFGLPWNVTVSVAVSLSLVMCYSEHILRLKV